MHSHTCLFLIIYLLTGRGQHRSYPTVELVPFPISDFWAVFKRFLLFFCVLFGFQIIFLYSFINVRACRGDAIEEVMNLSNALGERLDHFISGLQAEFTRLQSSTTVCPEIATGPRVFT